MEAGDSRAVFKNVDVDMRQYKKLKMFLHAESLRTPSGDFPVGETDPVQDNKMVAFIRFGNDFTNNFYQIEMPLKITPQTASSANDIWPAENEMDLRF